MGPRGTIDVTGHDGISDLHVVVMDKKRPNKNIMIPTTMQPGNGGVQDGWLFMYWYKRGFRLCREEFRATRRYSSHFRWHWSITIILYNSYLLHAKSDGSSILANHMLIIIWFGTLVWNAKCDWNLAYVCLYVVSLFKPLLQSIAHGDATVHVTTTAIWHSTSKR